MGETIRMDELAGCVSGALAEWYDGVEEELDRVLERRTEELRDKLEARSPKDTGEYAAGWAVSEERQGGETVRTVYNEKRPELTVWLEYGTRLPDGRRRMEARQHIRRTEREIRDAIGKDLTE